MVDKERIKELQEEWSKLKTSEEKNELYFDKIYPLYYKEKTEELKKFISTKVKKPDILISTVGLSPATTVFMYNTIKPSKRLICIGTEKSLNLSLPYINEKTNLKDNPNKLLRIIISDNTKQMYKKMLDIVKDNPNSKIFVDITGGYKTMSMIAGIIATNYDFDIGYLQQNAFSEEKIILFDNPAKATNNIENIINLFNNSRFSNAEALLEKNYISINKQYNADLLGSIIKVYKLWHYFNCSEALDVLKSLIVNYEDHTIFEKHSNIKKHKDILAQIKKDGLYQTINYYFSAKRFASVGQFDIAVFLLYRTIEKVFSEKLLSEYKIKTNKINNKNIDFDKFKKIADRIYKDGYKNIEIPSKIGLMDSGILLCYLGDKDITVKYLKELKEITDIRNESHFTHGERVLKKADYEIFLKHIDKLFKKLLRTNNINFKEIKEDFLFPILSKEDF